MRLSGSRIELNKRMWVCVIVSLRYRPSDKFMPRITIFNTRNVLRFSCPIFCETKQFEGFSYELVDSRFYLKLSTYSYNTKVTFYGQKVVTVLN